VTHTELQQAVVGDMWEKVRDKALQPSCTHTMTRVGLALWWGLRRQVKDPVDNVLRRGFNDRSRP